MNILRKKRRNELKKVNYKKWIIVVFFFIMSTFAWFVYYKVLDVGVAGHISSWNVEFIKDNEIIGTNVSISFDSMYPGMQEMQKEIQIKNKGESIAKIGYIIKDIEILGKKYKIVESNPDNNELNILEQKPKIDENKIKTYNLINDKEKFPFTITIENIDELLGTEEGKLIIKANWLGDTDELDTKWGYDTSKYFEQHPEEKSMIKLNIKLNAYQIPKSDYENNNVQKQ